jgi:hypothetical protein
VNVRAGTLLIRHGQTGSHHDHAQVELAICGLVSADDQMPGGWVLSLAWGADLLSARHLLKESRDEGDVYRPNGETEMARRGHAAQSYR